MLYDLIIIGGGPAGITAGIYVARKQLKTVLVAKDFWGQVGKTDKIDNWPGSPKIGGMELMSNLEKHLKALTSRGKSDNFEIQEGKEVLSVSKKSDVFFVKLKDGQSLESRAVVVATGATPQKLGVKGEVEFEGKGVSYCSICDAPFFKDKQVIVAGGGNSGLETALDLAKYAKSIYLFESSSALIADEILQDAVRKDKKIKIHVSKEIIEIQGDKKIESVMYKDTKTGKTFQIPAGGVFVSIGYQPASGILKGVAKINKRGEVEVNHQTFESSVAGLFVVGDVNDSGFKQIIIAAGQGATAALAVHKYLQN